MVKYLGQEIMTTKHKQVYPTNYGVPWFAGTLERFIFNVRLKPSLGGSRICTRLPYAALIASMAPKGSPDTKIVSEDGVGNDTDSKKILGFFIETYNYFMFVNRG